MDRAEVVREGTDVTLIAYGPTVRDRARGGRRRRGEGLSIEVIDLRSLSPSTTRPSGIRRKTSRAAVIHEAAQFGGYGAEVAARVTERDFHHLAAPCCGSRFDIPYPSPKLEEYHLPTPTAAAALDTWEWDAWAASSSCPTSARA